ncbi:MAG: metallophosphoesterase [Deltaproteobacteria bacterium]|nr:metallophosphoesterase [Deltaproteobacteria bacterium]
MKKIKVMALSDLHLGEPEGLLYNKPPNILDILVAKVSELANGGGGIENGIEELILIGDIADLSEAKPEEAYSNTRVFLTAILKKVSVDKVIYIPGNHDHHLWVEMLEARYGKGYKECFPKTGVSIQRPNALMERCIPADYKGDVEAYYPFYKIKMDNSYFLFDHGHLFSSTLNKAAGPVSSLEEIEEKTWEFMEKIWFQGGKSPWIYNLREKIYDWARWISLRAGHPTRGVSFKEDSTPVFDDGMRDRIVTYLEKMVKLSMDTDDFHLVFGHTHYGGRVLKDDRKVRVNGRFINLWNTGGWLVPSEVFSPDAFIFYIEQTQNGLRPQAYKLVGRERGEVGDYDRAILKEIVKRIG